jgi:hypothetical protein
MLSKTGDILDGDVMHEWYAVAFQNHGISPQTFPHVDLSDVIRYWKVLSPAGKMMKEYWAVVPGSILLSLDLEMSKQGYRLRRAD